MQQYFTAELSTFDGNGEGDQVVEDKAVACEVISFNKDGAACICFDDRNERVYLQFTLADLLTAVAYLAGKD